MSAFPDTVLSYEETQLPQARDASTRWVGRPRPVLLAGQSARASASAALGSTRTSGKTAGHHAAHVRADRGNRQPPS